MLAGFNLVYDGSGGGCSGYLDEVDEPLDRCRCLAVDEPAGKAVRVPGGGGPVECAVDYSWAPLMAQGITLLLAGSPLTWTGVVQVVPWFMEELR